MMRWISLGGTSLWALIVLSSCSGCYEPPNYYATEAFHHQRELRALSDAFEEVDEFSASEMLLNLEQRDRPEWRRKAFETIDEWLVRIEGLLYMQRDVIASLRTNIQDTEVREKDLIERVQRFRTSNEQLRTRVFRPTPKLAERKSRQNDTTLPPPPFNLHLVKQGDTLYSIAVKYYGEGDKVHDIMEWNQGWVRYPERILAGLPLILFPEQAEDTSTHVVEHYMSELEKFQSVYR